MKKKIAVFIVWAVMTAAWFGLCLFLTWQKGDETRSLSIRITRFLLRVLDHFGKNPSENKLHSLLRLCAHFGIFFIAGAFFCGTAEALIQVIPSWRWVSPVFEAAVTVLSLLADVPKIWIPGRHLTWSESALNAIGALMGYLAMLVLYGIVRTIRKRLREARQATDPT